jgi:hypothetical protein
MPAQPIQDTLHTVAGVALVDPVGLPGEFSRRRGSGEAIEDR